HRVSLVIRDGAIWPRPDIDAARFYSGLAGAANGFARSLAPLRRACSNDVSILVEHIRESMFSKRRSGMKVRAVLPVLFLLSAFVVTASAGEGKKEHQNQSGKN